MKKTDRNKKQSPGSLSDEDLMLWQHLTNTLHPLDARNKRITPVSFDEPGFTPTPPAPHAKHTEIPHAKPQKTGAHAPRQREKNASVPPQLSRFDPRQARKIRAGRIQIESKLDLHGMRQHQAHGALRSFLMRAHARKQKWVLVITGKGTFARDTDAAHSDGHVWDAPQRGVLRRSVPMWLEEPDLRSIVVSYTAAAVHHGGEGALYVQLRSSSGKK
ncbi:MAG: Smr/MutS family protein [Alphaproteobacteria bacterium]|nr:Smr/MutS family protein [Alphaproteobacteria bacterium]